MLPIYAEAAPAFCPKASLRRKPWDAREVLQPRICDCNADGAAQIAHKIKETGGIAQFFRAEVGQGHIHGGRDAQKDRKPAQRMRPKKFPETPLRSHGGEHPESCTVKRKTRSNDEARISAPKKHRCDWRPANHGDPCYKNRRANLEAGKAADPAQ